MTQPLESMAAIPISPDTAWFEGARKTMSRICSYYRIRRTAARALGLPRLTPHCRANRTHISDIAVITARKWRR